MKEKFNIAVAGTGYVGLSIAVLLSQNHAVWALDIVAAKVKQINAKQSPIEDEGLADYLVNKSLLLQATLDKAEAYANADFVVVATPTDYDPQTNFFNTESVEAVIQDVLAINPRAVMVIKSTVPVGFTAQMNQKYGTANLLFLQSFCGRGEPCMTTSIPAASWWAMAKAGLCRLRDLLIYCSKAQSTKTPQFC